MRKSWWVVPLAGSAVLLIAVVMSVFPRFSGRESKTGTIAGDAPEATDRSPGGDSAAPREARRDPRAEKLLAEFRRALYAGDRESQRRIVGEIRSIAAQTGDVQLHAELARISKEWLEWLAQTSHAPKTSLDSPEEARVLLARFIDGAGVSEAEEAYERLKRNRLPDECLIDLLYAIRRSGNAELQARLVGLLNSFVGSESLRALLDLAFDPGLGSGVRIKEIHTAARPARRKRAGENFSGGGGGA